MWKLLKIFRFKKNKSIFCTYNSEGDISLNLPIKLLKEQFIRFNKNNSWIQNSSISIEVKKKF